MGRRRKQASRTLVIIVQDKSGSMHDRTSATIGGFNEYKNTLRRETEGDVLLTLTQFDTRVGRVHSAAPIHDVPDLNRKTYVAGGMTALYDAVGQAVRDTERVARKSDKVLVVIMTDGGENSSTEYSKNAILDLFEVKRAAGWEFVFLGAGEEAWAAGQSLGFDYFNSINYGVAPGATADAYSAMATSTSEFMRGVPMAQSLSTNSVKMRLETDAHKSNTASGAPGVTVNWNPTTFGDSSGFPSADQPDQPDQPDEDSTSDS